MKFSKDEPGFEHGSTFDLNKEVESDELKEDLGRRSKMLAKYPEFKIVLITMNAGSRWDDHKTNSRISVQVLRGQIRFHTPNKSFELCPGQLIILDPAVLHSVDALEKSAFVLTLAGTAGSRDSSGLVLPN